MSVPRFSLLGMLGLAVVCISSAWASAPSEPTGKDDKEALTSQKLEAIWNDLRRSDEEGTKCAYQHICLLIRHPRQAVPFLRERLAPVAAPDAMRVGRWIADLDSNDFATREKASIELENLGPLVRPALSKRLESRLSSLEVRRRLERLLGKVDSHTPSPDELRALRAMEVLEGIGSPEAKQVIATLAGGAAGAVLKIDARRALNRLDKQFGPQP